MGREEPLISEFLTTALEKLLPNIDGKTQIIKIHTPSPSNFLPPQPVDATHALNLSAGVSNSKVFRGRSLS